MAMNPQEELFAAFFRDEALQIKDLKDFELQQRREDLAKIAHEARARLSAVDEKQRENKAKRAAKGFTASVQTDELTSNAINAITERNVKMSKREKMISNLMNKTGVDRATAEAMVPDIDKVSKGKAINSRAKLEAVNAGISIKSEVEEASAKPFVNPFAPKPKEDTAPAVEVQIIPETDTVIVTKQAEPVTNQLENLTAPKFVNPFAK